MLRSYTDTAIVVYSFRLLLVLHLALVSVRNYVFCKLLQSFALLSFVCLAPLSMSHAVHGEPFMLSFSSHGYMMRNWACIHPLSPQCKGTAARRRHSRRQPSSGMMKLERRWLSVTSIRSRSTALLSGLFVTPRLVWEYCHIHARILWIGTLILFSLKTWVHFWERWGQTV